MLLHIPPFLDSCKSHQRAKVLYRPSPFSFVPTLRRFGHPENARNEETSPLTVAIIYHHAGLQRRYRPLILVTAQHFSAASPPLSSQSIAPLTRKRKRPLDVTVED